MATKLLKWQGRREKNYQEFWHAKNEGEKKGIGSQVKRKGEKLICGNGIAENGRKKKKNCGNGIAENWREKVVKLKKNILQHRFLF